MQNTIGSSPWIVVNADGLNYSAPSGDRSFYMCSAVCCTFATNGLRLSYV